MTDTPANIDVITELIREHAPIDVALWWLDSLVEFNTSGRKTLCACLSVEPYTQKFPSFSAAKEARNKCLCAAYRSMASPSIRNLQARLEIFMQNTWPNVQAYAMPPERLTATERELFFALKTGVRIPGSVGQLAESVRKVE